MPLIRNEIKLLLREAFKNKEKIGLSFYGYEQDEIRFVLNRSTFTVNRFFIEINGQKIPTISIIESFYIYYYFRKLAKYIKYTSKNSTLIERDLILKTHTKFLTDKLFSDKVNSIINK